MKKQFILMLAAGMMCCAAASAQGRGALRLNEVMVENTADGYADEYGAHHGWIEIFNSNFSPIEISSIYLTNDSTNKKKYPVPLGDVHTKIPKRQHVVFYTDGEPNKGTFHTNFVLTPGQDNWIGLYDADGLTLIDEIVIPASLTAGQSYARTEDGKGDWSVRTGGEHDYITPSSANIIKDKNQKIEDFAERDANGFGMTLMAMCIVFSSLLLLCLCFYGIGKINSALSRKKQAPDQEPETPQPTATQEPTQDSNEVIAAIAMALQQHFNAHDTESNVLTINRERAASSPWSSKIYNMREVPTRK